MSKGSNRLLSLDVFRGITIAGMILVNSPGNQTAFAPLEHAEWNGWTPTDLIFPFFVFILGVSIVFSFMKRREDGENHTDLYRQILKRTLIIFGLGLLLNGFPYYHLQTIRIPGVLQRIALCYFFCSLIFIRLKPKTITLLTPTLLIGYWALMKWVPVPHFGAGILSKEGSLSAYLDRLLLSGHIYRPEYDPEGILSTIPAVATGLIGVLTGIWISKNIERIKELIFTGILLLILGQICNLWFPINKALWTSSYVLFTGGMALLLFGICYWLIELKGIKRWGKFFEVFGVNGLAAYFFSILFLKIQNRIPVTLADGSLGNLRLFITKTVFESWTTEMNASLLYASFHTMLWFLILSYLYRKRIFIKI